MPKSWMCELRKAKGLTMLEMAARAKCSETLIYYLETFDAPKGTTAPELAKQVGRAYGMSGKQIAAITNEAIAARRKLREELPKGANMYGRYLDAPGTTAALADGTGFGDDSGFASGLAFAY